MKPIHFKIIDQRHPGFGEPPLGPQRKLNDKLALNQTKTAQRPKGDRTATPTQTRKGWENRFAPKKPWNDQQSMVSATGFRFASLPSWTPPTWGPRRGGGPGSPRAALQRSRPPGSRWHLTPQNPEETSAPGWPPNSKTKTPLFVWGKKAGHTLGSQN